MVDTRAIVPLLNLVLTILGAIGGILWIVDQFGKKIRSRAFFRLFPSDEEILIVVPSLGSSGPNILMTFEDALACASAQAVFVQHRRRCRIKVHTQVTEEDRFGTMFVIGGEIVNTIMADIARLGVLPFRAEHVPTGTRIVDSAGNQLNDAVRGGENDYAIAGVIQNPWNPDLTKRIYVAAGVEGIGTWAAAVELTSNIHVFSRHLTAHDVSTSSRFEAVLTVRVHGYQVPTSYISHATQLP